MNLSLAFIRAFFLGLCILTLTTFTTTTINGGFTPLNILIGVAGGTALALSFMVISSFFQRFNLRVFNIAMLGLFIGYLMGQALFLVVDSILNLSTLTIDPAAQTLIRAFIFLSMAYLGMCMTARAAEELYVSIPFIKFKPTNHKKKDLLIDASILQDSRILDLASSGLLDNQLILPRFTLKDIYNTSENGNEIMNAKARRSVEVYKKLENMPNLDLRYVDTDFHDIMDPMTKLIRLARLLDANIITSDINRIQQSTIEGVSVININTLANALKPISQAGEYINIKIQHPGKGARQGVGYLDDGTMVVINGGADNIGETIKAQVLSVKHTSSGRMIFCNSTDEGLLSEQESALSVANLDITHKNYFSL